MPDNGDLPIRTAFFRPCRAAFEGGGCRGAAHVGAYLGALESGVRFCEVAGTSAGSIIAGLIGAGANSGFIKENLADLDFQRFLVPPDKNDMWAGWFGRFLRFWPIRKALETQVFGRSLLYGGAYSSKGIQLWMDELLGELFPDLNRPVQFRDLVIPTSIVTADLGSGVAKVWSTEETPSESLALAVRCSCSIPGFFQPVEIGTGRFVDGGMLSNLPSFVFGDNRMAKSLGGRVLGFTLSEDFTPPSNWDLITMVKRLIGTVVSGATDLQTRIQKGVHIVSIPAHGVKTTDFDKMTPKRIQELENSGRESTIDFIRNESAQVQEEYRGSRCHADADELYTEFVQEAVNPGLELLVSDNDTQWFWKLFPTVLSWRLAGASVRVLVTRPVGADDSVARETQRRKYLEALGIPLIVVEKLPIRGFFVLRTDDHGNAAFVLSESQSEHASFASSYIGSTHREIIHNLSEVLISLMGDRVSSHEAINLTESAHEPLIRRLKTGVRQYKPESVSIRLESVKVSDMLTINRRVRSYKLAQIERLAKAFRQSRLPLFGIASVNDGDNNEISVITPPVLEKVGDRSVVIEGNTRALYAFENKIEEMVVLHVYGVQAALPGIPTEMNRVLLSSKKILSTERIENFSYEQFRSIEGAARPI